MDVSTVTGQQGIGKRNFSRRYQEKVARLSRSAPKEDGPPTRLGELALPNVAPCFRLRCAAVCEKCGVAQRAAHCPTVSHGFRCDSCCEVCNPALAEKTA